MNPAGTTVVLTGTTTIQPNVVIKYAPGKQLEIQGPIACQSSAYKPAIFTSRKDNSVGESVVAGTPSPADYALAALKLNSSGQQFILADVHVRWASEAVRLEAGSLALSHAQIHQCGTGLNKVSAAGTISLRNVLVDQVTTGFAGNTTDATTTGQHLTLRRISTFRSGVVPAIALKNSLLESVGSAAVGTHFSLSSGSTTADVPPPLTDSSVFQTAGASQNYLRDWSAYRDKGVSVGSDQASLDFEAALRQRTTFAPVQLANLPSSGVLGPIIPGDLGGLDLGYHFVRLDWLTAGIDVPSAGIYTLVLTNGVAVGVTGASGFRLGSAGYFASGGLPHKLNRLVFVNSVQERTDSTPTTLEGLVKLTGGAPSLRFRFTELCVLSSGVSLLYNTASGSLTYHATPLSFTDCQLMGGSMVMRPNGIGMVLGITNSILEGLTVTLDQKYYEGGYYTGSQPFELSMRNNLIRGGSYSLYYRDTTKPWNLHDNFFDGASVSVVLYPGATIGNTYNGYYSTAALPGALNSKYVTSVSYVAGKLGNYYYSTTTGSGTLFTELVDTGSRLVGPATLAHHTLLASNAKDTGTVDRGFHYVAMDTVTGLPKDTDGDTRFDYEEDGNGSGNITFESGETPWWTGSGSSYDSANGLASGSDLRVFTLFR